MESRIAAYLQLPKPDCPRRRSGLLVTAGRSISKCWRRVGFKSFIYKLVPINHLLLPALWSQGMALAKDKRPSFSTANLRTGNSGSVSSPMLSSTCPCHWFSLHLSRSRAVQRLIVKDWGGSVCSLFLTAWSLLPLSMLITRLSESTPFLVNETSFQSEWFWLTNYLQ